MEYLSDLLKRSDDFRIILLFSKFENLYHATLQRRDAKNRWLPVEFGIGDSLEASIESLNEIVMEADGAGNWEEKE